MSKLTMLDEARRLAASLPGPLCDVRKALLDHPELSEEMSDVIREHSISAAVIEDVFLARDINISQYTIRRHRLNRCVNCRNAGVTW